MAAEFKQLPSQLTHTYTLIEIRQIMTMKGDQEHGRKENA